MHDIAQAAADAAEVPDFGAIERRGRARRRRRQGVVLGAAAVSVAVVVGVTQVVGGGDGAPRPTPAPTERSTATARATATPEPRLNADGLAAIVDAKDARVHALAVTPGDPDRMAALWRRTEDREVLALTDDGFATRTLVEVPPASSVRAMPDGRFVVMDGWQRDRIRIFNADGSSLTVPVSGKEAPLGRDEVAVDVDAPGELQVIGVGPDGTAHPVPTPADTYLVHSLGGRLVGMTFDETASYVWSDDGGATWETHDLGVDSVFVSPVPSAAGEDHAVVEGADGATLFPLVALHTASGGDPATWTRTTFPRGDLHWTLDGGWVEDDAGVRLLLTGEPTQRGEGASESGVYRVVGGVLEPVEDIGSVRRDRDVDVVAMEYSDGPVVWIAGEQHEVWRTTDGGATWEPFRAR